ncbi:MAG: carbohydrate ABC transporter permease [Nitrososphaeria archaeon]
MRRQELLVSLIALLLLAWTLFPIYNMVVTSLESYEEVWKTHYLPPKPALEPYLQVITQTYWRLNLFWVWLWNSLRIAFLVALFSVVVSSLFGYSISNKSSLGRKVKDTLGTVSVLAYIFPSSLLSIPMFILLLRYSLLNTDLGLTLALSILTIPFNSWMATQYFNEIPREFREASQIDGASTSTFFFRILLPTSIPMIIAISVYSFMFSWNNYLYPLLIMGVEDNFTLPIGMSSFLTSDDSPWNIFMATSIVYALPPVIVYYLFKQYLVSGLFRGAIKG